MWKPKIDPFKDIYKVNDEIYEEDIINKKLVIEQDSLKNNNLNYDVTKLSKEEKEKIINDGLSQQEVEIQRKRYGFNKLIDKKKTNVFFIFIKQLKDIMILLLFIAMVASFVVAVFSGHQNNWNFSDKHLIVSFVEPFIILFIIILYAILGGVQELKSQEAVASLKKMTTTYAKVIRDKEVIKIPSEEIVVGDTMIIESGDSICADGYLIDSSNLFCIESSLTGESNPTKKDHNAIVESGASLGDQTNMIFSGCSVTNGRGICLVTGVGQNTEIGKIATLITEQKTFLTPLQIKLNKLGKLFGFSGLVLFILTFLIQIFILGINSIDETWQSSLTTSISLAVATIPEGLGAFTTIILSIGIRKMAKYNALIKKVSSVETLGNTSVICSDKTGTLTQNKMMVKSLWTLEDKNPIENLKKLSNKHKQLLEYAILCSDSYVLKEDGNFKEVGDPTEIAFIYTGIEHNLLKKELDNKFKRIYSIPFDSDRKLMSSVNLINNEMISIVKGAPDILLSRCKKIDQEKINKVLNFLTNNGYRVLAVGSKKITDNNYTEKTLEYNLEFLGLFAIYDPPREETYQAIKECIAAGIKTVMITGDHVDTAKHIAKEIGIYQEGDIALTGAELSKLSDSDLESNIDKYSVFARVNPEDKLRIVQAWQKNDQVVAMTGDGVNDAPALKAADIGCAMGITGTDVSKEAADIILLDDNFKTIVSAISNGRQVYQTIKRVIQNVLLSSIAEILVMFLGILIFRYAYANVLNENNGLSNVDLHIFSASQLLWINLMTDGFPAIALGIQGTNENLMNRRPYSKYESIFAKRMGLNLLWQGLLFGLISLVAFVIGIEYSEQGWFGNNLKQELLSDGFNSFYAGSACSFIALAVGVSVHALSMMSNKSIFKCNVKEHWIVWCAVIFSIGLVFLVTFIPNLALVFTMPSTTIMHPFIILIGLLLAIIPMFIMELYKVIFKFIEVQVLNTTTIKKFEMVKKSSK